MLLPLPWISWFSACNLRRCPGLTRTTSLHQIFTPAKEPPPTHTCCQRTLKVQRNPRSFQLVKGNHNADKGLSKTYKRVSKSVWHDNPKFHPQESRKIFWSLFPMTDDIGSRIQIAAACKRVVNLVMIRGLSVLDSDAGSACATVSPEET